MGTNYIRKGNKIFAIKNRNTVGQLKFRIKDSSQGKVLVIDDIGVNTSSRKEGIGSELSKRAIYFAMQSECSMVSAMAQPEYLKVLENLARAMGYPHKTEGFFISIVLN